MGHFRVCFEENFTKENQKSDAGAFDMGPAGRVSPLIKTARWGLLVAGIYWGMKRYNANKATEDAIREHNARMKPIWDAEKAAAKAKSDREGLLYLANETGVKVPAGF